MGPDSQGRHYLSRKICPIIQLLIIFGVFFPLEVSCHKGANESNDPGDYIDGSIHIGTLHENGSTSNGDSDYVTGEFLRKALVNHTLTHGGEQDLDQLIFSAIPQGSKLVLQSVKVIETDEHGNPLEKHRNRSNTVHWDVKVTNATSDPGVEDEDDEDDEGDEGEVGFEPAAIGGVSVAQKIYVTPEMKSSQDLASAGSHSQANYKAYGTQERNKEKVQKQHHGNDQGKNHKITKTDTDGKTVTNYHGKEDGVKDYAKDQGKSQTDEGERYRDTKKKNKGRRVSGFKRVYHKEEFQRTEHFYDDEDAKRIAESYGLKNKKEDSKHGIKDDDRKYHGKKTEYTDGKEIKDEKSTNTGFNKGQHTAYKDSEKDQHNAHYAKSNAHGSLSDYNQNNNHPESHEQGQQQKYHHPSHNYHGSYSHPKTTVRQPNPNYTNYFMNFKPGYLQTHFTPSSNPLDNANTIAVMAKVPLTASFVMTEPQRNNDKHDSSSASSTDDPAGFVNHGDNNNRHFSTKTIKPRLDKPDEMKMYFSPRNRHVPNSAKHSHPPSSSSSSPPSSYKYPGWANNNNNNNFPRTTFRSKLGNASYEDTTSKSRVSNSSSDRYSRKYPMLSTLLDPNYGGYSTLVKLPVNYISLGGGEDATRFSHDGNASETRDNSTRQPHGAVSDYQSNQDDNNNDHTAAGLISESPILYHPRPPQRPHRPPHRPRWVSLSLGDPELVNDIQSNPFNRHPIRDSDLRVLRRPSPTINNIMRGVKHKLTRPPGYPPPHRYPPPHHGQYDSSKYPPNVVVLNSKSEKAPHNYSVPVGGELDSGGDRSNLVSGDTIAHNNDKKLSSTSSFSLGQGGGFRPGQVVHVTNRVPNRTRMPHTLPPFMNSLMDSVANFFGNVG